MKQEWFSYKDVAERWGIAVQTLRVWKMQKKLKPVKFGSRVKFHINYILELEAKGVPSK